ncbi:LuxR family maltose regulon positive regulatory protein [Kribbella steppae]|uniref:LuxR family maltose regulon positive regulatory protein n=1 Tax=Kribbella steppae TaxID=2512223 RepID=A0A4R2HSA3_9ACTN|nr:LuxR C-terminal-related transcriptional regulator [Kribbella steppae]TCO33408.1 LuxR family maltose regulon positive regulatory protein [Kribbella steppae]
MKTTEQAAARTGDASDDPVLAVRFAVPGPPRLYVERPRLIKRLDEGAELPLTLVSAPAGSGKTALVAAWAAQREAAGYSTAWITFEERDVPASVFWPHVLETLRRQGLVLPAMRSDTAGARSRMLTRLATALSRRSDPMTLVLDGYEIATAEQSSDIDFLLRHSDQRLHVVILTRVDPVLPLHRYRLAEMVAEVRMADLAFTEDETSQLVRLSGISMSSDSIGALTRRTRGWAVGLRFAGMCLERSDNPDEAVAQLAGDSGNIAEYLMAEVLQTQSAAVRSLLLRTSVVDVLQPGLIEELGGRSAGRTLASLAGGNVLVEPLPDHPGWYRYHPFLRDLLRAELAHESPTRRRRLHKKAADWFARKGFLGSAVGLATAVGAWTDASAYVVDGLAIGQVLLSSDTSGLDDDLRKMPPGIGDPAAGVVRAALALADRDTDRCADELKRAGESMITESAHDQAVQLAADIVQTVRSGLLDDPQTVMLADLAQQELTTQEREKIRAHPELTALIQAIKGIALLHNGELLQARAPLMAAVRAEAPGCEALTVACLGYLAVIDSYQGELRCADEWAAQSVALAERSGLLSDGRPRAAEIALARVSIDRHDLRAGREHVRAAMRSDDICDDPVLRALSAVVQARLLRAGGEVDEAIALLQRVAAHSVVTAGWLVEPLQIEAATLMVVQGEPDVATRMIKQLGKPDDALGSLVLGHADLRRQDWGGVEKSVSAILAQGNGVQLPTTVGARLLEVACELHGGQPGRARIALDHALRLAEPEGLRRPFLEAPTAVRRLLEADTALIDRNGWLGSVVGSRRQILASTSSPAAGGTDVPPFATYIEPLTAKETEVLGHLSELLSTEEIAAEMFVSVNTVRTHIRNILRKLAVSRRNEAVRRARALSLIPA